jgi:hypothetical protein
VSKLRNGRSHSRAAFTQGLTTTGTPSSKSIRLLLNAAQRARRSRSRFAAYGYLKAVYRLYRRWRRGGISKTRTRELAKTAQLPIRRGTHPIRIVIDATSNVRDPRVKSRWTRALETALKNHVPAIELGRFFRSNGGIAGCSRLAAELNPKKSKNSWV